MIPVFIADKQYVSIVHRILIYFSVAEYIHSPYKNYFYVFRDTEFFTVLMRAMLASQDNGTIYSSYSDHHRNLREMNYYVHDFSNKTREEIEWFFYSRMDHVVIGIVMPVILSLGFLGNGLFMFVTFRVKSMRTITNFYLISLAFADVCYLAIGIGEKLACLHSSTVHSDVHAFGVAFCLTIFPMVRTCAFASLFLVTLVTLDKYDAICRPIEHRVRTSPGRSHTKYVILAAWVVAFCLAAMTIPASSEYFTSYVVYNDATSEHHPELISYCWPVNGWIVMVVNGMQTLPFFFALFPNFFMYFQIIRKLNDRLIGRNIPQFVRNGTKMRNTVAKMLVLNGSVFFTCNMPFHTLSLIYVIVFFCDSATREFWQTKLQPVQPYVQLLLYVNSAVNPYIYNAVNRTYRKALYKAILCQKRIVKTSDRPSTRRTSSTVYAATEVNSEDTHL